METLNFNHPFVVVLAAPVAVVVVAATVEVLVVSRFSRCWVPRFSTWLSDLPSCRSKLQPCKKEHGNIKVGFVGCINYLQAKGKYVRFQTTAPYYKSKSESSTGGMQKKS